MFLHKKIFWKRILLLSLITTVCAVAFILFINYRVNKTASGKIFSDVSAVEYSPVAVVLGTSRYLTTGGENQFFSNRIQAVADLYFAKKIQKILVSGDNSVENYNEPRQMRNELIKKGIPDSVIVLDFAGFRTFDSMVRAKEIFGLDSFIVVSQQFHCERAIYIAKSKGMHVQGYAAKDPQYVSRKTYLREYPARVSAFLDCYILQTEPHFYGEKIDLFIQK